VSPYLRAFVVARVNPMRFSKATEFDFDKVFGTMTASAKRFDVDKVHREDLARKGVVLRNPRSKFMGMPLSRPMPH
jgi:ParB family transcriptional regulator, chromosome partitioning protein